MKQFFRYFCQQEVAAKILSLVHHEETKLLSVRPLSSELAFGHQVRDDEGSEKDTDRSEIEPPPHRHVGLTADTVDRGGNRSRHERHSRSKSRWLNFVITRKSLLHSIQSIKSYYTVMYTRAPSGISSLLEHALCATVLQILIANAHHLTIVCWISNG